MKKVSVIRKTALRLFAVAVLVMMASGVQAQDNHPWGVLGGVNFTRSSAKDITSGVGGQIGVLRNFRLGGFEDLQTRLEFSFAESIGKKDTPMENSLFNRWSLTLPVMYSLPVNLSKDTRLRFNLGPYVQYSFFGQSRQPLSPNKIRSFWHSPFGNKFTYGVHGGLQLEYQRWLASLDVRYSLRKNPICASCDPGREQMCMFSLGWRF